MPTHLASTDSFGEEKEEMVGEGKTKFLGLSYLLFNTNQENYSALSPFLYFHLHFLLVYNIILLLFS